MEQNTTRIQLIKSGTTGTQGFLDVAPNTNLPLNFSVADIRDISKKKGTFSKSITLAGTKNNHDLLNHYFDVNIKAGTFDINKIQNCVIIQNGVTILDNAVMQLTNVNKKQLNGSHDEQITYTVLVKDTTSDFFAKINNKLLTDLNFTDLNHIYTAANVIASFDNTLADGYKYVVPYTSQASNSTIFDLQEFTPAIYAKKYFDNIFADAGFGYVWSKYNDPSVMFDKLVIPYNGDESKTSEDEINYLTVIANNTVDQFYNENRDSISNTLNGFNVPMIVNTEIQDNNNNYNPTTSIYSLPVVLEANEELEYEYEVTYTLSIRNQSTQPVTLKSFGGTPALGSLTGGINFYPIIINKKGTTSLNGTVTPDLGAGLGVAGSVFDVINVPSNTTIPANSTYNVISNKTVAFKFSSPSWAIGDNSKNSFGVNFKSNNSLTSFGWYNPSNSRIAGTYKITIHSIKQTIRPKMKTIKYNSPIVLDNYVPKQIKQSDFIKSIFTMYNLFIEVDKNNPRRLILTSRDEYYDNGKAVDWTKKLAKDQPQDVEFLPELQSKKLLLTYKQDTDSANKTYFQATDEVYGQVKYTFDNEYVKGEEKQELIFSPTPISNSNNGIVGPMWSGRAPKNNIRILIDGGRYTCTSYKIKNYAGNEVSTTYYPSISHWDRPTNPTFDINFSVNDYYFRSDDYGADTNNNLFNLYWRRTMNQINTGKMMTAYFNLDELDVQQMALSDKIRIDNSWWNINKVIDYDANSKKLTKVELISIDDTVKIPFKAKIIPKPKPNPRPWEEAKPWKPEKWRPEKWNWGNSVYERAKGDVYTAREWDTNVSWNGATNVVKGTYNTLTNSVYDSYAFGTRNYIAADTAYVMGNDNQVFGRNSMVLGNTNTIMPSAVNSMVVGSNIIATRPNAVIAAQVEVLDKIILPNAEIAADGTVTVLSYIIDGGACEVMNIAKTNLIDVIDGGFNSVRNYGGDSKARPILDGGLN